MKKIISLFVILIISITTAFAGEGDYIVRLRENKSMTLFSADSAKSLGANSYLVSEKDFLELKKAGLVIYYEPDIIMELYDTPNDTLYSLQYNLPIIKANYAWSFKTFGNDVLVGVIDSGLAPAHPDIDYSKVVAGFQFKNDGTYTLNTADEDGHGTMVSGVIAAKRNNGIDLAGIADKVKIVPLNVASDNGYVYTSSVIKAVFVGAGYFGCDVLNLSLGNGIYSQELKDKIDYALDLNCIVVAAVGNYTSSDPGNHLRYPAAYEGVIGVGSTTSENEHAASSVANESVFVCAPADGIPLLNKNGGYSINGGTSFASPQVAAAAAIAKSIKPGLTPSEFADILKNSVTDLGEDGRDIYFGFGLLNIENMINYMLSGKKSYVSPFDTETKSVTIFNLTPDKAYAESIFGAYSDGKMVIIDSYSAELEPNSSLTRTFSSSLSFNRLRHYLWKSDNSAAPYEQEMNFREMPVQ
ncbi:MAG: S8 family serine peptidase [Monoglobales bacterium]